MPCDWENVTNIVVLFHLTAYLEIHFKILGTNYIVFFLYLKGWASKIELGLVALLLFYLPFLIL